MEEYLLQHNVTLTDFWTFVALWIIGVAFITFLWVKTIQLYKEEKRMGCYHNWMMWITSFALSYIFVPVLAMGAVHFVRMMVELNPHMNLIHWLFILCIIIIICVCILFIIAIIMEWIRLNKEKQS